MDIEDLLKSYLEFREIASRKKSYSLNIIDELHANENAHTRILLKLLDYRINGKFPILIKFIDLINQILSNHHVENLIEFKNTNVIITGQYEFIDGYIKDSEKKWAIIIENKINWADDQESQIDRYVETAQKDGISPKNIYVIYLTDNGVKKISNYSFNAAKKILDYQNPKSSGRFIEINYRNDILPFLKDIYKELESGKENILKAAIYQYIDYLEGRFFMRESDREYNKIMNEELVKKLDLEGLSAKEKFDTIGKLQWEIWNHLDQLKHELYPNEPNYIAVQLREFLKNNYDTIKPYWIKTVYANSYLQLEAWGEDIILQHNVTYGIDIGIESDTNYYFQFFIKKLDTNDWCHDTEDFFNSFDCQPEIKRYFESNSRFTIEDCTYTTHSTYQNIEDLKNQIMEIFAELCKVTRCK